MLAKLEEKKTVDTVEKKVQSDSIIDSKILREIANDDDEGTMKKTERITLKTKLAKLSQMFKKDSLMKKLKITKLAYLFKGTGNKMEEVGPSFLQHQLLARSDLSQDVES